MKKIALLLALLLAFTVLCTACGKEDSDSADSKETAEKTVVFELIKRTDTNREETKSQTDYLYNARKSISKRLKDKEIDYKSLVADEENMVINLTLAEDDYSKKLVDELCAAPTLTFKVEDKVVMDSDDIESAEEKKDPDSENYYVELICTPDGAENLKNVTLTSAWRDLMIYLDDRLLASPKITSLITSGVMQVMGEFSLSEAKDIAEWIDIGLTPYQLQLKEGE